MRHRSMVAYGSPYLFFFFLRGGAQCIAAGSHIANHEAESVELRPHAINLTKYMCQVREAIREQCFTDRLTYSQKVCTLIIKGWLLVLFK